MEDVDVLEVVFLLVESVQTFDTFEDGFAQLVQSLDVLWVGLFAYFLHEFWVRGGRYRGVFRLRGRFIRR